MANLYRVVYSTANGPQASAAVNVLAVDSQDAKDTAKAADEAWTKVVSVTLIAPVDLIGTLPS